MSISTIWEYLKLRIKEFTISFCIQKATQKKNMINQLEEELNMLDKILIHNTDECTKEKRNKVKAKLDQCYKESAKGYQIRSRANWIEQGEKSTSYFLNLEQRRQGFNCINALRDENNITHYETNKILDIAQSFYSNLYCSRSESNANIDNYLADVVSNKKLSHSEKEKCEGLITLNEGFKALNSMKHNIVPGLDGMNVEFYLTFWNILGPIIVSVFNESYNKGILPDSQRKAVISLIFKKGDHLTDHQYSNHSDLVRKKFQSMIDNDGKILDEFNERLKLIDESFTSFLVKT